MKEWQKRVVDEKHGLDSKIQILEEFIGTETYKELEHQQQFLLRRQLVAMHEYSLFGRDGRPDQFGTWCGECGEKVFEVETRQCAGCKHVKRLLDGWICSKQQMVVVPCLHVTYKISQGSCFEEATNG